MTLREIEQQRRQSERDRARDDLRVIRWKDWYESKGISKWTANRMLMRGEGPRIVELRPGIKGVTVRDDREWTEARRRNDRALAAPGRRKMEVG
jgi:hypothetical protein